MTILYINRLILSNSGKKYYTKGVMGDANAAFSLGSKIKKPSKLKEKNQSLQSYMENAANANLRRF